MKLTENNRTEFKARLTDRLEREVVAFLNYREGGVIYIGIDDAGNVIGVPDVDGTQLTISNRIRDNIQPATLGLYDVVAETMDGKDIIKIIISSGNEKPYYLRSKGMSESGCFLRTGSGVQPMTSEMISELYAKRTRNSLSKIESPRDDLTFEQLRIYYEEHKLKLNSRFKQRLELLTKDGKLNYVAYLLADENSMSIKVAKYAGTDRDILVANNEFGFCSLLKATDQVLDKLKVENNVSSVITYKRRVDTPLWDERAMREIVINAIVHNDYYTNEVPPKFEIFSDHIEITSAGRLPVGMSQEDFFGGISSPRNKELMRVFRDVDLVESLGSGMRRIQKVYSREIYLFLPNFIRVAIPFYSQKRNDNDNEDVLVGSVTDDFGSVNGSVNLSEPTKRQLDILAIISDYANKDGSVNGSVKSGATTKEIISKLNVSERTIYRELAVLKQMGLIRRVGSDKTGHWEVVKGDEDSENK